MELEPEGYFRDALEWMVKVARTPLVRPEPDAPEWYRERVNGLAAYTAWARRLLEDETYAGMDQGALRADFEIHNILVGQVAEARWYGSQFLIQAANPDFHPPLSLAEALYMPPDFTPPSMT